MSKGNRRERRKRKKYGNRLRGGTRYVAEEGKFVCVISLWNTPEGLGEPDSEWYTDERFDTEEEAMRHYKSVVRPMMMDIQATLGVTAPPGTQLWHQKLEE